MPKTASKPENRLIKRSFSFRIEDATPAGVWANVQALAVEELGAAALPSLLAAKRGCCVYLPAPEKALRAASLSGLSIPYASLPDLYSELEKLAPQWDIPFEEELLRKALRVFSQPEYKEHVQLEGLAFIEITIAVGEAIRWNSPLWLELDPKRIPSNEDQILVDEYIQTIDSLLTVNAKRQRETVPEIAQGHKKHTSFSELTQRLVERNHAFREELAQELQPTLNAHIQAMPQETLEDKKAICDVVAKTLEPLGLAVKVPNTPGLPGKLKATSGHWPGRGRFYFEVYMDGKPKRPALSDTTPNLELIDATPAAQTAVNIPDAAEGDWQKAVGPKSSRQGHRRS